MLELSNLLIMWAVVVTAVIALGFYRLLLGMHEDPGSHLEPEEAKQLAEKQAMNRDRVSIVVVEDDPIVSMDIEESLLLASWRHQAASHFAAEPTCVAQ